MNARNTVADEAASVDETTSSSSMSDPSMAVLPIPAGTLTPTGTSQILSSTTMTFQNTVESTGSTGTTTPATPSESSPMSTPVQPSIKDTKLAEVPIPCDTSDVTSTDGFSDAWRNSQRANYKHKAIKGPRNLTKAENTSEKIVRETQVAQRREMAFVETNKIEPVNEITIEATLPEGSIEAVTETIPEEDSEESAHEEVWHDNVPRAVTPSPAKHTQMPARHWQRDKGTRYTKTSPVRMNITKGPQGTTSEAQLQRLVDEIARLKEDILRRHSKESVASPIGSTAISPASSPSPIPNYGTAGFATSYDKDRRLAELKGEIKAEISREIKEEISQTKKEVAVAVENVASVKRDKVRPHEDRHWDEFNETKSLARLPTAKIFRPQEGEDVESSEILIPDSLTDFTQVDDEAERRRNARAPLSEYANDPDHQSRDSPGSPVQG